MIAKGNSYKLLIRDVIKHIFRIIEQVAYRFKIQRGKGSAIALDARLDIGKKLSLKPQNSPFKLTLGEATLIESRVTINTHHGEVNLDNRCSIGIGTILIGPIDIKQNTTIAQNVFITGENRKHTGTAEGLVKATDGVDIKAVTIGEGVWIGANVTILPGVDIGEASIIAAGSVVTKNIPSFSIAAGVPAKVIKKSFEVSGTNTEEPA